MEYRVELSARAERNLIHLYEQIRAEDSVRAARWFNRLEKAVYSLDRLPHRCPVAPESRRAKRSLRHLLYGNKPHIYRVIFEIDEPGKTVYVLTIRHGAREPAAPDELR